MEIIRPKKEDGIIYHVADKPTPYKYNGWPSVCRDERGVLYAVASSMRLSHVDPQGKNCMWVSFNEGKTWTPPIVVNDSYLDDRDMGICYLGNGKLVISWFTNKYDDNCMGMLKYDWLGGIDRCLVEGYAKGLECIPKEYDHGGAYVKTSDDYGVTWSDPIEVDVSAPHGPSVCKDGTLIYMGKAMYSEQLAEYPIVFYTSTDDGKTWNKKSDVPVGKDIDYHNMIEPHVIELPSGRLLGAIRVHDITTQPDFTVYTTFSDDKGVTWSKPMPTGLDGSPPQLMVHSSGAVVLSYSRRRGDGNRGERAAVSHDGGETWSEDYNLNDNVKGGTDLGYPCTIELSDGSLMTVYYQCLPGEWYTSVLYTKWNLEK